MYSFTRNDTRRFNNILPSNDTNKFHLISILPEANILFAPSVTRGDVYIAATFSRGIGTVVLLHLGSVDLDSVNLCRDAGEIGSSGYDDKFRLVGLDKDTPEDSRDSMWKSLYRQLRTRRGSSWLRRIPRIGEFKSNFSPK